MYGDFFAAIVSPFLHNLSEEGDGGIALVVHQRLRAVAEEFHVEVV